MRLAWLADTLRTAGLIVVEHGDWLNRGRALQSVEAIVCHHTASPPRASDDAVVRLLIEGRADLPGPLCQLGLDRLGRYHMIAGGRGNHNGYGLYGNQSIGIEAFNDGIGEPWPDRQMDAWVRGCAAICRRVGWPAEKVVAHKETDPRRKIDPLGVDMRLFRARVDTAIRSLDHLTPAQPCAVVCGEPKEYPNVKRATSHVDIVVKDGKGCTPGVLDVPFDRFHDPIAVGPYPFVDGWNGLETMVVTAQERDGKTHINLSGDPKVNAIVRVRFEVDVA